MYLSTTEDVLIGTFADDTALIATHKNPEKVLYMLQENFNKVSTWLKDWRIETKENMLMQITFLSLSNTIHVPLLT